MTFALSAAGISGDFPTAIRLDGATKIKVKGKGGGLGLPDLSQLTGVLDVQRPRRL
jgi:hypothetical protein